MCWSWPARWTLSRSTPKGQVGTGTSSAARRARPPAASAGRRHHGTPCVGRPAQGCVLRRIRLRECSPKPGYDGYDPSRTDTSGGPRRVDTADRILARWRTPSRAGVRARPCAADRGADGGSRRRVLARCLMPTRPGPTGDRPTPNIMWMRCSTEEVVRYGAAFGAGRRRGDTAHRRAMCGREWFNQQSRLLYALDRWIERLSGRTRPYGRRPSGPAGPPRPRRTGLLAAIDRPGRGHGPRGLADDPGRGG